ncbi:MAG: hypothetical protein JNM31_15335 [Flavobacteriales bacterium]|nr:hypothetical protein [Flavobacteriales bacterium]
MKQLTTYVFPALLTVGGATLLFLGLQQGQNTWVLLGAGLAMLTGVIMLLLQLGIISRSAGKIIGIACAVGAVALAWRDYRSVKEVLEFQALKKRTDTQVIQALKDVRNAQLVFRQVYGGYTGNMEVLRSFVKEGKMPLIRAIGQKPDTLSEEEALKLQLIVRDTILVPVLDSTFLTKKAMHNRAYAFNPDKLGVQPITGQPLILKSGVVSSSGRNVPVFVAKDPSPMVAGDTLMVGSLEKASTSGNWTGE